MSMFLLLALSVANAASPEASFTFSGQPECVGVVFTGRHIRLTNTCSAPLLIDQSVQIPSGSAPIGFVLAGTVVEIRDLSYFTLGLDGQIYGVTATLASEAATMTGRPHEDY